MAFLAKVYGPSVGVGLLSLRCRHLADTASAVVLFKNIENNMNQTLYVLASDSAKKGRKRSRWLPRTSYPESFPRVFLDLN
jgi:hypothetical protein